MRVGFSIVHGVKRFIKPKGYRNRWLAELQKNFSNRRVEIVEPYYWVGSLWGPFSPKVIKAYANHLCRIQEECQKKGIRHINIISKSMGSILVKNSIDFIRSEGKEIRINNFLRIATPDNNWCIDNKMAKNIISISSPYDRLYKSSRIPMYPFVRGIYPKRHDDSFNVIEISLDGLRHSDFNKNCIIQYRNIFSGHLFDFYFLLMTDRSLLAKIVEYKQK